jgi:hypothetical protein
MKNTVLNLVLTLVFMKKHTLREEEYDKIIPAF